MTSDTTFNTSQMESRTRSSKGAWEEEAEHPQRGRPKVGAMITCAHMFSIKYENMLNYFLLLRLRPSSSPSLSFPPSPFPPSCPFTISHFFFPSPLHSPFSFPFPCSLTDLLVHLLTSRFSGRQMCGPMAPRAAAWRVPWPGAPQQLP